MDKLLNMMLILVAALSLSVACSQKSDMQEQAAKQQESKQQATLEQSNDIAPTEQVQDQEAAAEPQDQMAVTQQDQGADVSAVSPEAQAQEETAASEPEEDQPKEISGTIVRTDEGVAIFGDSGSYMIAGQELSDLVGKSVKLTGTVDEAAEKPIITVISVSLIE